MSDSVLHITLFTLAVALLSTALVFFPGIALSWFLARKKWRGKSIVETFVALPLVIPPVATGLILLKIFGRRGPLGGILENALGLEIVFTWKAVVLATTVMAFPMFVRAARVAFEEVDIENDLAAQSLGAGPLTIFFRITMPLAIRGIVAGGVLAFARSIGEFGATVMLAGLIPGETITLALGIYHNIQLGHDDEALALLCISLVMAFAALWLSERLTKRKT
ncbi:MAG: molybdate ABC transporter permease subunit [Puniceicoccales bacterium]|jgi:molybdate transport system permease protein|nr:molybdate ABC transporter permease subunit [Puniceicoccales bacterium]